MTGVSRPGAPWGHVSIDDERAAFVARRRRLMALEESLLSPIGQSSRREERSEQNKGFEEGGTGHGASSSRRAHPSTHALVKLPDST